MMQPFFTNAVRTLVTMLIVAHVSVFAACRPVDGIVRHRVSGTVRWGDRPLPAGSVYFEPDIARGNDGPVGYARVVAGAFDTALSGKGAISGPHRVRIDGHEPTDINSEQSGRPGFSGFIVPIDLPATDSVQDFAVPATAGRAE